MSAQYARNHVSFPVKMDKEHRERAHLALQEHDCSARQFILNSLDCVINDELDITLGEIIQRAKSRTKKIKAFSPQ